MNDVVIIDSIEELQTVSELFINKDAYINFICSSKFGKSTPIFTILNVDNVDFIIGHNNVETLNISTDKLLFVFDIFQRVYVNNKKLLMKHFELDSYDKIYDVSIIDYLSNEHAFKQTPASNSCTLAPIYKLYDEYKSTIVDMKSIVDSNEEIIESKAFDKYNNLVVDTLCTLEKNGLYVNQEELTVYYNKNIKSNVIYPDYDIRTSTGRPSNSVSNINLAAINSTSGARKCFRSRFDSGKIVLIDYDSFHLRLIATLINYDLSNVNSVHDYLAKLYFETDEPIPEERVAAKQLTFEYLYGGIKQEVMHIDYFRKTKLFIDRLYSLYQKHGYLLTPIFSRKIEYDFDNEPKLFNYLLQAYEFEYSCVIMNRINRIMQDTKSKFILYTYDSFMFDVCVEEKQLIRQLKQAIDNSVMRTKVYVGDSYDTVKIFNL